MVREMSEYFEIRIDRDLSLMYRDQPLSEFFARSLLGLDQAISDYKPHFVLAQGDTSTVVTAAVAAFYRRTRFVHVEAGLRTRNLQAPWPEEWNRRVVSLCATIHCAPTQTAAANLRAEGIPSSAVHVTGNTIVDALNWTLCRQLMQQERHVSVDFPDGDPQLVLITAHRRENIGQPLERICEAVSSLAQEFPSVQFVFPMHLNPQVREVVDRSLCGSPNVRLTPPIPYPDFIGLMNRCCLILTDSGGIQEEACSLQKPLIILRDVTERPEVLQRSNSWLLGTDAREICRQSRQVLIGACKPDTSKDNPIGDGHSAERIVDLLLKNS